MAKLGKSCHFFLPGGKGKEAECPWEGVCNTGAGRWKTSSLPTKGEEISRKSHPWVAVAKMGGNSFPQKGLLNTGKNGPLQGGPWTKPV